MARRRRLIRHCAMAALLGSATFGLASVAAQASTCSGSLVYSYTGFVTTSFAYRGMEALVSDAAVNLEAAGIHILEYVDSLDKPTTGLCNGQTYCWAQNGWGFGTVNTSHSGADQRPYFERNDPYGYYPYFDTSVGVHCCGSTATNDISNNWDGMYDVNGYGQYTSYFNNTVGSGTVLLGYSYQPPPITSLREDMTGEEENNSGTCAYVGNMYFAAAQLRPGTSWSPWTSNGYENELTLPLGDPFYYPFSSTTDYTAFTYAGG